MNVLEGACGLVQYGYMVQILMSHFMFYLLQYVHIFSLNMKLYTGAEMHGPTRTHTFVAF